MWLSMATPGSTPALEFNLKNLGGRVSGLSFQDTSGVSGPGGHVVTGWLCQEAAGRHLWKKGQPRVHLTQTCSRDAWSADPRRGVSCEVHGRKHLCDPREGRQGRLRQKSQWRALECCD